jgi:catechol 2,3-dioxygenase-like lactoylglutathione lyase family enzyme
MLTGMPLDHIGINVPDVASAREYYGALMPLVGFAPFASGADWFSYGPADGHGTQLFFYVADEGGAHSRHRPGLQHLCFLVETRAAVDAAHRWALERGDEVLHEPQTFPQYHPNHYAVYWVDPRGFKLEVVSFAATG